MKDVDSIINEGLNAHKTGHLELAFTHYSKALELSPKNPKLLYFYGILESQRGNNEHAEQLLEQCSQFVKNDADVEYNLGTVCQQVGKHKKAIRRFKKAIAINPQLMLAHLNLGASLIKVDEYADAIPPLKTALTLSPGNEDVLFNLTKAYFNLGDFHQFLDNAQQISLTCPHYADVVLLTADVFIRQGSPETAIDILNNALHEVNDKSVLLNKLGDIYFNDKQYEQALACHIKATEDNPTNGASYTNLGRLLYSTGDLEQSLQWLHKGIEHCPNDKLIQNNLALIHLSNAQLSQGWSYYIHRSMDRTHSKRPPFPKLPEDLTGQHVYLVPDQGIGDQLFFLRFIPLLLLRHAEVKISVNEKLLPVLESSDISKLLVSMRQIPLQGEIFELGDLPYLLDCGDEDFLPPLPLKTTATRSRVVRGNRPNIGITWRGGIPESKTLFKEIGLTPFLHTLSHIEANWYILQRHPAPEELQQVRAVLGNDKVYDVSELNEDLAAMLELLDQLDDHIGVSNTNVHLRSSLGKEGRVLIPNPADWRWLSRENYSPWVPGYKIYRQQTSGDWGKALKELSEDLIERYEVKL